MGLMNISYSLMALATFIQPLQQYTYRKWGYTDGPTDSPVIHLELLDYAVNGAADSSSIDARILCGENIFTDNDKGTHMQAHRLKKGIYEVCR
jgi:hypothetical protein